MTEVMQEKACAKCVYWAGKSEEKGDCRRHAPQSLIFNVTDKVKYESCFPTTAADDWCGDYLAKN